MDIVGTLKKIVEEYQTESPMNEPLLLGLTAGFGDDYALAIKYLDEAIDLQGTLDEEKSFILFLKSVSLSNLGRYEDALSVINLAIQFDSTNQLNWSEKGDILHDLERQEEALEAYEKSLELSKIEEQFEDDIDTVLNRADVLSHLERHEEALEEYERSEKLDPYSTEVLFGKAYELFELKKYQESLTVCEKGLSVDRDDLDLVIHKGIVKLELGFEEEALKYFEKATVIDSADELAWYNKACALARLNRKEEALDALTIATGINSDYKESIKDEKDLENIKNEERFTRLLKQSL